MLNRYLVTAVVVACLFTASLGVTVSYADEASHRQAAEDVLIASGSEKNYEKGFMLGFGAQMKNQPPEIQKAGLDFSAKYMTWAIVKEDVIKLYVENFSEQELKDITAFYATPTGKKSVTLMPELLGKGMASIQQRIAAHMDELKASLEAATKEVEAREAREKLEKAQAQPEPAPSK